jgi:MFS family permease
MSLQPFLPWLILALLASVAGMVTGARHGSVAATGSGALVFALVCLAIAWRINQPLWQGRDPAALKVTPATAARRNARLMAFAYAWGGAAMLAVYTISGLRWRHGWQYGLGMALIAVLIFGYAVALGHKDSRLARPTLLAGAFAATAGQAVAAAGALLVFFVLAGPIDFSRGDWAANIIFLVGGLTIIGVSLLAAATHRALARRPAPAPPSEAH